MYLSSWGIDKWCKIVLRKEHDDHGHSLIAQRLLNESFTGAGELSVMCQTYFK